jgi:hypothetical protein
MSLFLGYVYPPTKIINALQRQGLAHSLFPSESNSGKLHSYTHVDAELLDGETDLLVGKPLGVPITALWGS